MINFSFFHKDKTKKTSVRDTIARIKQGDIELKNIFINEYKPFVLKCVSRTAKKYIEIENCEEFSVGLIAFNEAIDCYDQSKKQNFFEFAEMVIQRRLINFSISNNKMNKVYPFTYFDGKNKTFEFQEKFAEDSSRTHFERFETKEEIIILKEKLKSFGITFDELALTAPKHQDSIQLLIRVARVISESDEMYTRLIQRKVVPAVEILKKMNINKKTLERNRKYIIAVSLILRSDLDIIKGLIKNIEERGFIKQ